MGGGIEEEGYDFVGKGLFEEGGEAGANAGGVDDGSTMKLLSLGER